MIRLNPARPPAPVDRSFRSAGWRPALIAAVWFAAAGSAAAAATPPPADVAAIQAMGGAWQRAWNARDARALGALFDADATFVSVLGPDTPGFGRGGRKAFEEAHAALLRSPMFADSAWTTRQVDIVRLVRPDVAIAQVLWETTGDRVRHLPPGTPRRGLFLWVLEKRDGAWRIVASQNTEAPPTAAPGGPAR